MVAVVILVIAFLIAFAMFVSAALSDRTESRRRAVLARQRQVRADAIRVKSLLDQEAFRAARALHEAAARSKR